MRLHAFFQKSGVLSIFARHIGLTRSASSKDVPVLNIFSTMSCGKPNGSVLTTFARFPSFSTYSWFPDGACNSFITYSPLSVGTGRPSSRRSGSWAVPASPADESTSSSSSSSSSTFASPFAGATQPVNTPDPSCRHLSSRIIPFSSQHAPLQVRLCHHRNHRPAVDVYFEVAVPSPEENASASPSNIFGSLRYSLRS